MYLTLGQAAKETGKSKATISKYLKNGKMSYVSKDKNGYKIDPSELFRVFPKNEQQTVYTGQSQTPKNTPVNSEEKIRLELALQQIEDLKKERDDWKTQAQTLLLGSTQKPPERRKGFFWWLGSKED